MGSKISVASGMFKQRLKMTETYSGSMVSCKERVQTFNHSEQCSWVKKSKLQRIGMQHDAMYLRPKFARGIAIRPASKNMHTGASAACISCLKQKKQQKTIAI